MLSNSLFKVLGFTAFGESHGPAFGLVIEDILPGVVFPLEEIQQALNQRKAKKNICSTSRLEEDKIVVLSGVFNGKTTGMPICILVYNKEFKTEDYDDLHDVFRPGHADLALFKKFKIYDYRGGGRASGRETISRVIAGSLMEDILKDIHIISYPVRIGKHKAEILNEDFIKKNFLSWPDESNYEKLLDYLAKIRQSGNSIGGIVHVVIRNLPSGLGDPVFQKLDANLAQGVVSVGGVKGIEFGKGFQLSELLGSEANPVLTHQDVKDDITNISEDSMGGIYGGISIGREINFNYVVKPVPSIKKEQRSMNFYGQSRKISIQGNHDTCLIPRIMPAVESMIKLVLADALSYQKLVQAKACDLQSLREKLDKIDEDLILALYRRKKISEKISETKFHKNMKIEDKSREDVILARLLKMGSDLELDRNFIREVWSNIFENSKKMQNEHVGSLNRQDRK